jgi:hypothetical protein
MAYELMNEQRYLSKAILYDYISHPFLMRFCRWVESGSVP